MFYPDRLLGFIRQLQSENSIFEITSNFNAGQFQASCCNIMNALEPIKVTFKYRVDRQ